MKVTNGIAKFAIRLEGLPWKWVEAEKLFDSVSEFNVYAKALSKDAPHHMALAMETGEGFEFFNYEPVCGSPIIRRPHSHTIVSLDRLYVPFGFALDVEEWVTDHFPCEPEGEWTGFCDLTRTVEEGGDADAYFAAHFVGPSWWVVPYPS